MTIAVDFAELFVQHHDKIYTYVYRRTSDPALSEDLAAETFTKALEAIDRGVGAQTSVSGWLYRIAHNLVIDHYRWREQNKFVNLDDIVTMADDHRPETLYAQKHLCKCVQLALHRVTEKQRAVVTMRMEGYTHDEIAQELGLPCTAVKALQYRAFANMQTDLQEFSLCEGRPHRAKEGSALQAAHEHLKASGPMSVDDLAEATGFHRYTVYGVLRYNPHLFVTVGQYRRGRGQLIGMIWGLVE